MVRSPLRAAVAVVVLGVLVVWLIKPIGDPCPDVGKLPPGSSSSSSPSFSPPLTRECTYVTAEGTKAHAGYTPLVDWLLLLVVAGLVAAGVSLAGPGNRRPPAQRAPAEPAPGPEWTPPEPRAALGAHEPGGPPVRHEPPRPPPSAGRDDAQRERDAAQRERARQERAARRRRD